MINKKASFVLLLMMIEKNHSICTFKIGSDKLTTFSLNFYSYFTSGDKLKMYAYYVNQFGSGLKHDENLIIKKIIY